MTMTALAIFLISCIIVTIHLYSEATLSFDPQLTPRKQIRNLLVILFSGITCAILLTIVTLYYYHSDAHYFIKNALLSPDIISQISLNDQNDNPKNTSKMLFEKVEFSYQDVETQKRIAVPVDKKTYAQFYTMITNDINLSAIPEDVITGFNEMPASSLILTILSNDKTNSKTSASQIFQEVQFLYKGDYYRVHLRESDVPRWIYFYHPHIYNDVLALFTSSAS